MESVMEPINTKKKPDNFREFPISKPITYNSTQETTANTQKQACANKP